jgi:hypothetical protein
MGPPKGTSQLTMFSKPRVNSLPSSCSPPYPVQPSHSFNRSRWAPKPSPLSSAMLPPQSTHFHYAPQQVHPSLQQTSAIQPSAGNNQFIRFEQPRVDPPASSYSVPSFNEPRHSFSHFIPAPVPGQQQFPTAPAAIPSQTAPQPVQQYEAHIEYEVCSPESSCNSPNPQD